MSCFRNPRPLGCPQIAALSWTADAPNRRLPDAYSALLGSAAAPEDPARRAGRAGSACVKIAAATVENDAQIDQFVSVRAGCPGGGLLLTGDDKFERLRSERLDVVGETLDARA